MEKTYNYKEIKKIILMALSEDIGKGDITTETIIPKSSKVKAIIKSSENGVTSGIDIAKLTFELLDKNIIFEKKTNDGDCIKKGQILAEVQGSASSILKGERTALNFLQRLSGIATKTKKFVNLTADNKVKILDTRKTTPNLRILEKYAIRCGGGFNHRFGLFDGVLIKDNHLKITGDIKSSILLAKKTNLPVEIEVKNLKELKVALKFSPDIILLDNMNIYQMKKAIKLINKRAKIEVSGGVNEKNIKNIAKLGVDFISLGCLTHSVKSLDISLEIVNVY